MVGCHSNSRCTILGGPNGAFDLRTAFEVLWPCYEIRDVMAIILWPKLSNIKILFFNDNVNKNLVKGVFRNTLVVGDGQFFFVDADFFDPPFTDRKTFLTPFRERTTFCPPLSR